jgi:hypothetical protein
MHQEKVKQAYKFFIRSILEEKYAHQNEIDDLMELI